MPACTVNCPWFSVASGHARVRAQHRASGAISGRLPVFNARDGWPNSGRTGSGEVASRHCIGHCAGRCGAGIKKTQALNKGDHYCGRNPKRLQRSRFREFAVVCGSGCVESAIRRVFDRRL